MIMGEVPTQKVNTDLTMEFLTPGWLTFLMVFLSSPSLPGTTDSIVSFSEVMIFAIILSLSYHIVY